MGRWIGIDYGSRRIGLAISDRSMSFASPAATLPGTGRPDRDAARILAWAEPHHAAGLVVGLPLNLDGGRGAQAAVAEELAEALRRRGAPAVELWDERLTTFQADQTLRAAGLSPTRRKRLRDALAAQAMLDSFLRHRRQAAKAPAPPPAEGNPRAR